MTLYTSIAKYYDEIFPLRQDKIDFIMSYITSKNHKSKILDVGCGTGSLAIELSDRGINVIGLDLDKEMIQIAENNSIEKQTPLSFKVMDMLDISQNFSSDYFDIILCLGNTISHLSREDKSKFIDSCHVLLKKNGFLIIQILDYDNKEIVFPVIETDNIKFTRTYITKENYLFFTTSLFDKNTNKTIENQTIHYPITQIDLNPLLIRFNVTSFSGFRKEKSGNSTLFVAQKR